MTNAESLYFAEVHVSEALESHDIPDPYYFEIDELGRLVSPYKNIPIEDVVVKDSPLGKVEYEALVKIQNEVSERNSGFILWISPPYLGFYPTSKIVISQIVFEEGRKKLLNRAIVTDWDSLGSILVARKIQTLAEDREVAYKSATDVRISPIFINQEKKRELEDVLKDILDRRSLEMIYKGEDFLAKEAFMKVYLAGGRVSLGTSPLSCPKQMGGLTAFQVFSGESDQHGSLEFECPHEGCHKVNRREPGKLLENCQHCGRSVKCG